MTADVTTDEFIQLVATVAGDDETAKRATAAEYTRKRLAAGLPATGVPTLGHIVGDRLARRVAEWLDLGRPAGVVQSGSASPYRETPAGIVWDRSTRDGPVATRLTNFTARILADVAQDDGAEIRRVFEIEATLRGRRTRFSVSASNFSSMSWATDHLGAGAIVYPGFGTRDHARAAIQVLSGDVTQRRVYTHTGWREMTDTWVYLHAAGAIGPDGPVPGVEVDLPGALSRFALPDPPQGKALAEAVHASLALLDVAPDKLTAPLVATTYRTVLDSTDFTMHTTGPTGAGKSELGALVQQHWGAGLDARHLPGAWSSTANALEALAFAAKDALLVVDDFAPAGAQADVARLHRDADRLLRAQGNSAGRLRMRPDATLRPERPPRGTILSTGEDIPRGQSLRARLLVLEVEPGAVNWARLSQCQADAADGLYAQALAAFVQWLAPHYSQVRARLHNSVAQERDRLRLAGHPRTAEIAANLLVGLGVFLNFAQQVGAIDADQRRALRDRCRAGILAAASAQTAHQAANDPVRRFLDLLAAAIASGRAHLASPLGLAPSNPDAWGWRLDGANSRHPLGDRIGWVDGSDVYLEPDASYAAVQRLATAQGDSLTVQPRTLHKRLHERGLLVTTETGARGTLTVRKMMEGRQRRPVLHLRAGHLAQKPDQSAQPDLPGSNTGVLQVSGASGGQIPRSDSRSPDPGIRPPDLTTPARLQIGDPANGRNGQVGQVQATSHPAPGGHP